MHDGYDRGPGEQRYGVSATKNRCANCINKPSDFSGDDGTCDDQINKTRKRIEILNAPLTSGAPYPAYDVNSMKIQVPS